MRNRWSGKRRAGNFGDPFRKERQGEEKWEVMRQVSPCFSLLQGCGRILWIAFAGQGHCAKVVNRLFESGRRCGSNCFKVVVCLRILSSVRIKLTVRCTLGDSLAHSPMK